MPEEMMALEKSSLHHQIASLPRQESAVDAKTAGEHGMRNSNFIQSQNFSI